MRDPGKWYMQINADSDGMILVNLVELETLECFFFSDDTIIKSLRTQSNENRSLMGLQRKNLIGSYFIPNLQHSVAGLQ